MPRKLLTDLAALDALTDEQLQPDSDNPEITAEELAGEGWFFSTDAQQLDEQLAAQASGGK